MCALVSLSPSHIASEDELLRWNWEARGFKEPPFDDRSTILLKRSIPQPHPPPFETTTHHVPQISPLQTSPHALVSEESSLSKSQTHFQNQICK